MGKNNGTTIEQQIKAAEAEVQMYVSRMTWHEHQKALDDIPNSLKELLVLRQQEKIYMDGDVNEGYESRVKASTGKNMLIPKEDFAQLIDALKVIKAEAEQNDYRGLKTYKLCTELLAKHSLK